MIKKPADELVVELQGIHQHIENVLQDYLNEYADYGWDAICTELVAIGASMDAVTMELKYARVAESKYR